MARANRHYIPGYVWHITHRCHKQEFLLKYARDRKRWLNWLFEAKKRFGFQILDYNATSNHTHLVSIDNKEGVIAKSIQLIAGRTAQEYNKRKGRSGAFWEDRYHATAVETDEHLIQCLVYVDLNMVRAGVVRHPSEWAFSGYNEIQEPPERYTLIDYEKLIDITGCRDIEELRARHKEWVEAVLRNKQLNRQPHWTESVAVGSKEFVEGTREKLGLKVQGRETIESNGIYMLKESEIAYSDDFRAKKGILSAENEYFWDISYSNAIG